MTLDLVILDADHTIYTPVGERAYRELFAALADAADVPVDRAEAVWNEHYPGIRSGWSGGPDYRETAIRHTLDALGAALPDEAVDGMYDVFWTRVAEDVEVVDGTRTMLERLAGRYTLALATDEFPDPLRRKLRSAVGGVELFDAVVTPRDTGTLKPSERFYTPLIERFDVEPERAVMVGDSWERDLAPARELGMTTVHVTGDDTDADHRIEAITALPAVLGDT